MTRATRFSKVPFAAFWHDDGCDCDGCLAYVAACEVEARAARERAAASRRYAFRGALAAPGVGIIHGTANQPIQALRLRLADRKASGEAFEGEMVVRLPRRRP